ncbi:MAG: S1/P1 nuclease [Chitinophagaceae bacterium]|nr:S1/P1 nuclease [Chitinophagaceae bacterium]MCW5928344.1 S1/P1 nuclease [Chitinophagaceae bacterium]
MKSRLVITTIFLFTFFLSSRQCMGWGLTGHRVVAEIAERHLNKKARKAIRELMGAEPLAFWANWADFIKSDSSWRHAGKWHYVNIEGDLSREEFFTKLSSVKVENLYSQIRVLQSSLKDKNLAADQKVISLRFLIHLVGDLGQPLHVGREADQGGNKINVSWFGVSTNLHRVWDEHLVDFQQWSYTEYASVLNIASKEQVRLWQNTPLEECFYESYTLANKIYAFTPEKSRLWYDYNYLFVQDMNNQLLKSGVRLAKILNDIFG